MARHDDGLGVALTTTRTCLTIVSREHSPGEDTRGSARSRDMTFSLETCCQETTVTGVRQVKRVASGDTNVVDLVLLSCLFIRYSVFQDRQPTLRSVNVIAVASGSSARLFMSLRSFSKRITCFSPSSPLSCRAGCTIRNVVADVSGFGKNG